MALSVLLPGTYDRTSLAIIVMKGDTDMNIDPKFILEQYAKTNKNVREVLDVVNKTGDPKTAFYQLAAAKGIDPETILSMIRK